MPKETFKTDIKPIDKLFKDLHEVGIPLPSVIALAQDDFDDATRFILFNLIDNFIRKDYICLYVLFDKEFNEILIEWDEKIYEKRKNLATFADILSDKEKEAFLRIMDAEELNHIINKKNFEEFKKFEDYRKESKLEIIEVNNFSEFNTLINSKLKKHKGKHKIVIFENTSYILNKLNNDTNSFFKLCQPPDENTIIVHFITLSLHDKVIGATIGDLVDVFIHLKCIKNNIYRSLRSVGASKMKKVRESAEYNAYRSDEYGIIKELK